jgi:histidine ammonia-lyase
MSERLCWWLLEYAQQRAWPHAWDEASRRLYADRAHLERLLAEPDPPAIYGVNTLVGHLDDRRLPPEDQSDFQERLLRNHALGTPPYYGELEAACMGYCRMQFYCLGGGAISPDLFFRMGQALSDRNFRPRVPKSCSYSCGDVIPAAHWALDLLQFIRTPIRPTGLRPKEGLSLINGCFVHAGAALARLPDVRNAWLAYVVATRMNARLCGAHRSNYTSLLTEDGSDPLQAVSALVRDVAVPGPDPEDRPQDPVSVRAFPQVAAALAQAIAGYLGALDQTLTRRSDNPLVLADSPEPLSQASFLAPQLTLAAGNLVEAWLLALWSVERRLHWLLSGRVPGIPLNGSPAEGELGFIQVPKLATALLEETRLRAGRRTFASGSSTSYGIEDLWTFGLDSVEVLAAVLRNARRLLAVELVTAAACASTFFPDEGLFPEVVALAGPKRSLSRRFERLIEAIDAGRLPIAPDVFPFDT